LRHNGDQLSISNGCGPVITIDHISILRFEGDLSVNDSVFFYSFEMHCMVSGGEAFTKAVSLESDGLADCEGSPHVHGAHL
jgi:hypothetical protein